MSEIVVYLRSRPFFGAQLVMLPALYQLKAWWPGKTLRVVARDALGELYTSLPWVDEFVLAKNLRAEIAAIGPACDTVVGLHPSSELHGLSALLRRPASRIGFRNGRLTDMAWTHSVPFAPHVYRGLHCLQLLAAVRPFDPLGTARDSVAVLAAAAGRRSVQSARTDAGAAVFTFMPGGGAGEFKKWGIERFIALADSLQASASRPLVFNFVLGPDEAAEQAVLRNLKRADFQMTCRPSLAELAVVVMRSSLVVANDCGPSHLAQCSGVPFVGLFDEVKPEWFWTRETARCLTPPPGNSLQSLSVSCVKNACEELLPRGKY